MENQKSSPILSAEKHSLWQLTESFIWALHRYNSENHVAHSIMTTLWDQPRWLEAYHLYDDQGSRLFEQICDLPEYYLTRTENSLLESEAARIVEIAAVNGIVELGAGSAKKTTHLLSAQVARRGAGIFAPIDVSLPGLRASRDFVQRSLPEIDFCGLHASYEDGFSSIARDLPTLFVFLGSTIGNFNPAAFIRFFSQLSAAMGPNDFLLLGADCVKEVNTLEAAYADSRGITADFILNVFENINRITGSNFERPKMRYHSWYNPEYQQIEMYAVSTVSQQIDFPSFRTSFRWAKDERILVEISRKFEPRRLQQQLRFFDLTPVEHFTDPRGWFSLLLFKKAS